MHIYFSVRVDSSAAGKQRCDRRRQIWGRGCSSASDVIGWSRARRRTGGMKITCLRTLNWRRLFLSKDNRTRWQIKTESCADFSSTESFRATDCIWMRMAKTLKQQKYKCLLVLKWFHLKDSTYSLKNNKKNKKKDHLSEFEDVLSLEVIIIQISAALIVELIFSFTSFVFVWIWGP